jgi:hypothetical protein
MFMDLLQILAFLPNKIEKLCYEYGLVDCLDFVRGVYNAR